MKITQTNGDAGSFKEDFPLFVWEPEERYGHVMCPNSESFFAENEEAIAAIQAEIEAGRELWISFGSGFQGANAGVFKQVLAPFVENPLLDLSQKLQVVFEASECQERSLFNLVRNSLFAEQQRAKVTA